MMLRPLPGREENHTIQNIVKGLNISTLFNNRGETTNPDEQMVLVQRYQGEADIPLQSVSAFSFENGFFNLLTNTCWFYVSTRHGTVSWNLRVSKDERIVDYEQLNIIAARVEFYHSNNLLLTQRNVVECMEFDGQGIFKRCVEWEGRSDERCRKANFRDELNLPDQIKIVLLFRTN